MKALPDDLAVMDTPELAAQRALRDDEIAPLFQRWPALDRLEHRRLRTLYMERLRIARYVGRLRARRAAKDETRSSGRRLPRTGTLAGTERTVRAIERSV